MPLINVGTFAVGLTDEEAYEAVNNWLSVKWFFEEELGAEINDHKDVILIVGAMASKLRS